MAQSHVGVRLPRMFSVNKKTTRSLQSVIELYNDQVQAHILNGEEEEEEELDYSSEEGNTMLSSNLLSNTSRKELL